MNLLMVGLVIAVTLIAWIALRLRVAYRNGHSREEDVCRQLKTQLVRNSITTPDQHFHLANIEQLPDPVERYFRRALTDGQPFFRSARFRQSGTLRTGIDSARWLPFMAEHWISPPARAFVWNARIAMPLAMHMRVVDSYLDGQGGGRVSLMSAFPVASAVGGPELNSGALHRYLAEAVWLPTALLPEAGVVWSPIDDRSALATLRDSDTTVSLEFRFDRFGDVTSIYTSGRFGRFAGEYRRAAWEGHFSGYTRDSGMRVPRFGEVGWYDDAGRLQVVWKGEVVDSSYSG